jgi:DedD protein
MGLFSSSNKNKQDRAAAEDSGRFYSKDDDAALGERARAKRASNAGGEGGRSTRKPAADPMLPEKKRARRRLVGAIALALAAAVGLPMLLDSEPKPLAGDIAIQIPAKDKAAPLPVPGEKPAAAGPVAAEDSVDKDEEVIPAASVTAKSDAKPAKAEPKSDIKPEHAADDAKLAERKLAERHEREKAEKTDKAEKAEKDKAEARLAERHRADRERADHERAEKDRADKERAERLARTKAEEKARAVAILEGKQAEKDREKDKEKPAESASQRFVLQIAALSSPEKAAEVQARLREAGISSYTQKTTTPAGELIRVRVGPLSREDAEKVRAKLGKLGMSGAMTPV